MQSKLSVMQSKCSQRMIQYAYAFRWYQTGRLIKIIK
nr:MAG TPA: hypothetical protein [Caudoviricetes sp.]DAI00699.1 MAG TPA: hypothetical protein [Caudoviricetes sp.]